MLPIEAEEHWQSCTKLSLEEDGGLQKHVESWKEGLEEQSVAHRMRGASPRQKCLGSTPAC